MPLEIHLVPHTHWDREWYQPAEVFRQRLVDLIDELIDDPPADGTSFLLDGQTIVLEDYLAVRPDRREQLESLLRRGRVEAGPWYVLADELIPSGEALVRNLLEGRRMMRTFGAGSPLVLYCPDSFGHPAALPELAEGFGFPVVILWRGFGGRRWPTANVVRWRGRSGAETIVYHLPPDGYEFGSSLPADADAALARWIAIREVLSARSTAGIELLQNGADHHARQTSSAAAWSRFTDLARASGDRLHVSSLAAFVRALVEKANRQPLRIIEGELRDSYGYTWTLQGTFGTRAAQKRAAAHAERALLTAERWAALDQITRRVDRTHHVRAGWRTLLAAHPHDTLCGTSIDPVADAMDVRVAAAHAQAVSIANDAVRSMAGHDPDSPERSSGADVTVIQNDLPRRRSGVALVEVLEKLADERVGPGSGTGPSIGAIAEADEPPVLSAGQILDSTVARDRIEGRRRYPDNDIVRRTTAACWIPEIGGMSLQPLPATPELPAKGRRVKASKGELSMDQLSVGFTRGGQFSARLGEHAIENLIRFDDRVDAGDLYTASIRDAASIPKLRTPQLTARGPLFGRVAQEIEFVPVEGKGDRSSLSVALSLKADAERIEIDLSGVNAATNHRLRIGIATGIAGGAVIADAAFGPIERSSIAVSDDDRRMEMPPATHPLHRRVSVYSKSGGVTVHSDGLAEYEVDGDGVLWITLVRAIGELSRNDIPERPGHAGWPVDTPKAQMLGPFEARLAIHLHKGRSSSTTDEIERVSDDFLTPLRGWTLRFASTASVQTAGVELEGRGLTASSIKISEDGGSIVLRSVNQTSEEQKGRWVLPVVPTEARRARLDETPGDAIPIDGNSISFVSPPHGVDTFAVKFAR
jgi:alpha-mannosidase